MNKDIFHSFLKNKYFKHTIGYIKAIENKTYGRNIITYETSISKSVVLISATAGELQKMGYGKLIDNQTFFMFCNFLIGLNDKIFWKNQYYQRQNSNDYSEYGFEKYIISIYNENNLNYE